ncbi:MAG TPA: GspH/FimT family pseudopilin, partial [Gammaproteobacteria bacterium]|nr:GspH/FimT family pseudopilin [Gammaproteobacteria bacterium]
MLQVIYISLAMKNINLNKNKGFTLLELMATVAIVGILVAMGLPALGELVKNNRISTQANSILTSLHQARGEAVNRGVDIRVEPLVAGTDWSSGWRIVVDSNDEVLRNFDAVASSSLTSSVDEIVYQPNGQADTAATFT